MQRIIGFFKKEFFGFSRWFRTVLIILFFLYVGMWGFTIYLSHIQQSENLSPAFPVVPGDSTEYYELSQSIIHGQGFARGRNLETLRAPGYPAFVALGLTFGGSYFVITFLQIIITFAAALVTRKIGEKFTSRTVGEIAALLLIANPATLSLSLVILTDVLFLFLYPLGFYVAMKLRQEKWVIGSIATGIIFSSAIYIRPMGLFALPIIVLPVLVSILPWKLRWKSLVVMAFTIVLLLSPWAWRNYLKTGVSGFSSFKALNLSYTAVRFLALQNATTVDQENRNFEQASGVSENLWSDLRYSKPVSALAEKIIFGHPFSYAKYHILTAIPFFFPSTIGFALNFYQAAFHIQPPFQEGVIHKLVAGDFLGFFQGIFAVWWKILERLVWFAILITAMVGVWKRKHEPLVWAFVFAIAYLMLLAGPASNSRYALQAWPFLFILFGAGLMDIVRRNV